MRKQYSNNEQFLMYHVSQRNYIHHIIFSGTKGNHEFTKFWFELLTYGSVNELKWGLVLSCGTPQLQNISLGSTGEAWCPCVRYTRPGAMMHISPHVTLRLPQATCPVDDWPSGSDHLQLPGGTQNAGWGWCSDYKCPTPPVSPFLLWPSDHAVLLDGR